MRLILTLLMSLMLIFSAQAAVLPDDGQIKQEMKQAEANKAMPNQKEVLDAYQSALSWVTERTESISRSQQYRKAIDEFPKLTKSLRTQLENFNLEPDAPSANLSIAELEQLSIQTSSQLFE